jgi:hypothetical protein
MSREHRFELRLSDQELEWLKELSLALGVSQADALRLALRSTYKKCTKEK